MPVCGRQLLDATPASIIIHAHIRDTNNESLAEPRIQLMLDSSLSFAYMEQDCWLFGTGRDPLSRCHLDEHFAKRKFPSHLVDVSLPELHEDVSAR
jgi:hypothetical protein